MSAKDGRSVSYGQLRDVVGRFVALLCARGLGRNDRVALFANNSIEHLLCYFGVMAAGATVCTVHIEMNRNQLGNILDRLKPRLILYQDGLALDDLIAATTMPHLALDNGTSRRPGRYLPSLRVCRRASARRGAAQPEDDAIILFTSGTSATPKGVILNFREFC